LKTSILILGPPNLLSNGDWQILRCSWKLPTQHCIRPRLRMHESVTPYSYILHGTVLNLLTPNDNYSVRTAPLTSKCCILYIYSTYIGTEYFKHGIYSLFLPLQNAVCFIILTYLVSVLFTFCIQGVLKLKK